MKFYMYIGIFLSVSCGALALEVTSNSGTDQNALRNAELKASQENSLLQAALIALTGRVTQLELLNGIIAALNTRVSQVDTRVNKVELCNNQKKFYSPNDSARDGNGCVTPTATINYNACESFYHTEGFSSGMNCAGITSFRNPPYCSSGYVMVGTTTGLRFDGRCDAAQTRCCKIQ